MTIRWAPIGVAAGGVVAVAVASVLVYPVTQASPHTAPSPHAGASGFSGRSDLPVDSGSAGLAGPSGAGRLGLAPSRTPSRPARPGGKPGTLNTGAIAGVALTAVDGDQILNVDGRVIENVDIHGYVQITGKRVTLRNAIVRGGAAQCGAVVQIEAGASAVLEDVEIAPAAAGPCLDGIRATATTLTRVNVHGVVNGVVAGGPDVLLEDSWVHDLAYFASGAPGGGATETDAVETVGQRRITLRHDVLTAGPKDNAAWQVRQTAAGTSTDLRVEGSWLDGGGCTLNFAHGPAPMTGITVNGNRFGRASHFNCPVLVSTKTTLSQYTGNVFDDNGAPIPAPSRHD